MQISIDIRGFEISDTYGMFVIQTVSELIKQSQEHTFLLYTNHKVHLSLGEHVEIISSKTDKKSIFWQLHFGKILSKDGSHITLFFDEFVPRNLSKKYIVLFPDLKEIFFPTLWGFKKHMYLKNLHACWKKAEKVLCFDSSAAKELNEKIDVREEKIEVIPGFFPITEKKPERDDIKLDIKAKHNISGHYMIYDEKNISQSSFEKVLKIIERLKKNNTEITLVIVSDQVVQDVEIRKQALDLWIEKNLLFLWSTEQKEEYYYYTQSSGVIYSGFYSSFPFHFEKALMYKVPIFTSSLKSTQEIMGDEIHYFNHRSIWETVSMIEKELQKTKKTKDYSSLFQKLSPQKTIETFQDILSSWEENSWK